MLARWGSVAVLLLLALGSGWMLKTLKEDQSGGERRPRHAPDFFMRNFSTTTMDESGQPRRSLTARYMAHYPDTDTNEFEEPQLIVFHPPRPPWYIKSERGWLSANKDVMLLIGRVDIWRNNAAGERELEITTRDLRVLPESDYGETDKPVVLRTPTTETRSIGMRAILDERRVELQSRVRTVYEKPSE